MVTHKGRLFILVPLALSLAACSTNPGFAAQTLVSGQSGPGGTQDTNLVNPWGIAYGPSTYIWVANNATNTMTVYDSSGAPQPAGAPTIVSLPANTGATGLLFNSTSGFPVEEAGRTGPSQFITVAEAGTILGWNSTVDSKAAIPAVDHAAGGAIYKGAILATNGAAGALLYATDFAHNHVDVFDRGFRSVDLGSGAFTDTSLPAGYAPFGIRAFGGEIYVTYALQDSAKHDDVAGAGNGYVDVYGTDGSLHRSLVKAGPLNAPWGMAIAPSGFGAFGGALLVGNFGDGRINAFNPSSGAYLGALLAPNGYAVVIPGLWSITFGNGGKAGATNQLFFTSGPSNETHGQFGMITYRDK